MKKLDSCKVAGLLGVTEQQLELLFSVYRITSSGKRANPRGIADEYARIHMRRIQNPHFFTQLRKLRDAGFIKKKAAASYLVNFDFIEKTISRRREGRLRELKEFDVLSEDTVDYFRSMTYEPVKPVVEYLTYNCLFESMESKIRSAQKVYIASNFPSLSYTYAVAQSIGRGKFMKTLWERCFQKKELEVSYLTTLDVDFPFNHALRVYEDANRAFVECGVMLDQLLNQVESYDNFHVSYVSDLHGIDFLLPERKEPYVLFLFTRDEHGNVQGGIHIESGETAAAAKHLFLRDFNYAKKVKGLAARKIINSARKSLEEKCGTQVRN